MQVLVKANQPDKPITEMGNQEVQILCNDEPCGSHYTSTNYVAPDQIIPEQDFWDLLDYLREERELYSGLFDKELIDAFPPTKRKHYRKGAELLAKYDLQRPKVGELCLYRGKAFLVDKITECHGIRLCYQKGDKEAYTAAILEPYALPAIGTVVEVRLSKSYKWYKAVVNGHRLREGWPYIFDGNFTLSEYAGEDHSFQFRRI